MRIVLDTNVIIAAFASRGLCHSLFELCIDQFEVVISEDILNEVRESLQEKLKLPVKVAAEIQDYLKERMIIEKVLQIPKGVCRDPDDESILGLTKSTNVKYLITGDKDLLELRKFGIVKIVTPRQFWEVVKGQSRSK